VLAVACCPRPVASAPLYPERLTSPFPTVMNVQVRLIQMPPGLTNMLRQSALCRRRIAV